MAGIRIEEHGDVAEIVLDAPPLNLWTGTITAEFEGLLAALPGRFRAVMFRAEGEVFCGGVDVHEFQGLSENDGVMLMARILGLTHMIEALPVPTIAVVDGLNLTIGFELSLGCDLLWASDRAKMGLVEAKVGLLPAGGGVQRLVARAGVARAARMVLTGEVLPAATLEAWGIVNQICPADQLLPTAREYAAALAAGPTIAFASAKQLLRLARDAGTAAADAATPHLGGRPFGTEDLPAGIASLLEHGRGKAVFKGR
ncbi:enoyl-CoA hydratase/isomerase family protein [Pseudofrankia asymbiotica]|uniref:Enoyl-CoA hydratase n=1 Tax=Pseudofrankia asymbiotica TaxID=1834516 RepID=A0A1V2HZG2_9ACTN|nr:enoyl-CoA hydratase/isomerase family protein [Pseudofrankia asymbiotica]ONH21947.1 hypothetical protein BL253_37220 [Pseudofrankia asymbiotica]